MPWHNSSTSDEEHSLNIIMPHRLARVFANALCELLEVMKYEPFFRVPSSLARVMPYGSCGSDIDSILQASHWKDVLHLKCVHNAVLLT